MTDSNAPGAGKMPATLADSRPDTGVPTLEQAVDLLRLSVEAMELVIHGMDIDRKTLHRETPDGIVRRRWAAQLVILKNMFWDIEQRATEIYWILNIEKPRSDATKVGC